MATLTSAQRRWRARIEAGLHLAAPVLDLYLAAGERLSRAVERDDLDWVAPRRALPQSAIRRPGRRPGARLRRASPAVVEPGRADPGLGGRAATACRDGRGRRRRAHA